MLFLESVIEQVRAISDVRHPESKLLPLGVVHTGIMASFCSRIHCMRDPDSDCQTHGLIMGSDRVLLRYLGIQVLPRVYSASGIVVYQVCYMHWKQLLVAIFRDASLCRVYKSQIKQNAVYFMISERSCRLNDLFTKFTSQYFTCISEY